MPRANRYMLPGYTYHLTHRCVNKEFLLRFAKDRTTYRRWLLEGVKRHKVVIYGYCITSNHVHIIARVDDTENVARMMQLAAGQTALAYNRRKERTGAFWSEQYHCTLIENGEHFRRCMSYVDLNMVRSGVVTHPRDWKWCGYHEIIGQRQRNCLLSIDSLLDLLGGQSRIDFGKSYARGIDLMAGHVGVGQYSLKRQPEWTEALAVGSQDFIKKIERQYQHRFSMKTEAKQHERGSQFWILKESETPYRLFSPPKKGL